MTNKDSREVANSLYFTNERDINNKWDQIIQLN